VLATGPGPAPASKSPIYNAKVDIVHIYLSTVDGVQKHPRRRTGADLRLLGQSCCGSSLTVDVPSWSQREVARTRVKENTLLATIVEFGYDMVDMVILLISENENADCSESR
jgi:hypothetical protein